MGKMLIGYSAGAGYDLLRERCWRANGQALFPWPKSDAGAPENMAGREGRAFKNSAQIILKGAREPRELVPFVGENGQPWRWRREPLFQRFFSKFDPDTNSLASEA